MLPRPAPVPTTLLGEACVRPSQWHGPRDVSADTRGVRALLAELLREALREAGAVRSRAPLHARRQALAVAWLTGTLDAEVALPVAVVCAALDLDATALAAAVRARATSADTNLPRCVAPAWFAGEPYGDLPSSSAVQGDRRHSTLDSG